MQIRVGLRQPQPHSQAYEYDELFAYDKNGNLDSINRWSVTAGMGNPPMTPVHIDKLDFEYNWPNNMLNTSREHSGSSGGHDDPGTMDFGYDL